MLTYIALDIIHDDCWPNPKRRSNGIVHLLTYEPRVPVTIVKYVINLSWCRIGFIVNIVAFLNNYSYLLNEPKFIIKKD